MIQAHGSVGRPAGTWLLTLAATTALSLAGLESRPAHAAGIADPTNFPAAMNYIDQFGRVSSAPGFSGTYTTFPGRTPYPTIPGTVFIDQLGRVAPYPSTSGQYTAIVPIATAPSVANFDQSPSASLIPQTPPSTGTTSPTAQVRCQDHPATLEPSAAATASATPTPEPSSIILATALTGFLVGFRRMTSRRATRNHAGL